VGAYGVMEYTVSDLNAAGSLKSTSAVGRVTFVPPSGVVAGSAFSRDGEGWSVVGNKGSGSQPVAHEPSSRGSAMNHYVYGSDDVINTDSANGVDRALWYFQAPPKFLGHQGIAYGGHLGFTLASFHGDFAATKLNVGLGSSGLHLVELYCGACNVNRGVTLAFPVAAYASAFTGAAQAFQLPLLESSGWVEDPKNTLKAWRAPSQCTFIEVLSSLDSLLVLGDFTRWYRPRARSAIFAAKPLCCQEGLISAQLPLLPRRARYESVALDAVELVNLKAQVPVCAQRAPDASECTCSPDAYANTVVRQ
jgi:hypothetical protein